MLSFVVRVVKVPRAKGCFMNVFIYVFDGFADWEIAYLSAELASGRYFRQGTEKIPVIKFGATTEPVVTMGGFRVLPDIALADVHVGDDDILVLPGGDLWLQAPPRDILALAKSRIEKGLPVAAICGATIALAGIGALDALPHTSNDRDYLSSVCPDYRGAALYRNEGAVRAENLVTASGIAPVEFAAEIFRMTGAFSPETVDAWRALNVSHDPKYFYGLMSSLSA
jgi:putative intracellular protease/amidase